MSGIHHTRRSLHSSLAQRGKSLRLKYAMGSYRYSYTFSVRDLNQLAEKNLVVAIDFGVVFRCAEFVRSLQIVLTFFQCLRIRSCLSLLGYSVHFCVLRVCNQLHFLSVQIHVAIKKTFV